MFGYRFKPRLLPSAAAILGIAITCALGNWQLNRAAEKSALQSRFDALAAAPTVTVPGSPLDGADIQYRRVRVQGRYVAQGMVLLDNRVHHGTAGYEVIMPLRIGAGPMHVLVDRGWVAGTGDRARPPQVQTPEGVVDVSGIAALPSTRFLELSAKTVEGNVWQNLVLERYRQAMGLEIQPFVIQQHDNADDGLERDWPRPDTGIARHQGYAFQWFSLALLIAVFYVVLSSKRASRE